MKLLHPEILAEEKAYLYEQRFGAKATREVENALLDVGIEEGWDMAYDAMLKGKTLKAVLTTPAKGAYVKTTLIAE